MKPYRPAMKAFKHGTRGRNRTGMGVTARGILSPVQIMSASGTIGHYRNKDNHLSTCSHLP